MLGEVVWNYGGSSDLNCIKVCFFLGSLFHYSLIHRELGSETGVNAQVNLLVCCRVWKLS